MILNIGNSVDSRAETVFTTDMTTTTCIGHSLDSTPGSVTHVCTDLCSDNSCCKNEVLTDTKKAEMRETIRQMMSDFDKACQALDDRGGQCGRSGKRVAIDGHDFTLCEAHNG